MNKAIGLLIIIIYLVGCSTPPAKPLGIEGSWSYSNGKGEATITKTETNVTILMSYKPNSASRPHYRVTLTQKGNILSGTWICQIKGLRGCGKTNKVKFKIDPSGQSIIVLDGEDPDRHGIRQGFTLYRI